MAKRIEIPEVFPAVGDVAGKRVVLTGAGRGLGEVIAHALSRAGAKVALVARTERDLGLVAGALQGPTTRWPTRRSPRGAASTPGSATRGSRPWWPARWKPALRSGGRSSTSTSPAR